MKDAANKSRLRLARMVGDSILKEKILPMERLNRDAVAIIASQAKNILDEMEAEWEANSGSDELREGFHLLSRYLECLKKYRKGKKDSL
ncbi:MAG: hypothetical protein A4E57_04348 [Syntrophorhabdaceae bacterium PtaU1.Bin034]|nr:MAG: hypothetical protein A4E57_04348 [Syntrophorhabdaceae bacterium PtaU1.Bin034]